MVLAEAEGYGKGLIVGIFAVQVIIAIQRTGGGVMVNVFRIQIEEPKKIDDLRAPKEQKLSFSGGEGPAKAKPARRKAKKIGRNAPCPCGSGKKYKKCCGR